MNDPEFNIRGYALMDLRKARRGCLVSIYQLYDLPLTLAVEQR